MPEKDGDEGKSTKSVVNKKQKQMMGEEGYDHLRDRGMIRPSKDKKDATTMPPSKEMKKTQKVNKGPSAFERVKAKYGKSVMNVGKKKVKEELDLTKVAEAFGGYIIEGKVEDEKKKADAQFKKDFAGSLKRNIATQKALPLYKAGGPFVPDKTIDLDTGKKTEPVIKKPYMGKATVPKKAQSDDKKYSPSDDPVVKKADETSRKIKQLRKDVDKSKQRIVDIDTEKFFKEVEKQKRQEKGFENLRKAIKTGTTKSGESIDKIDREGTRDISTMNPSERERAFGASGSTEGGAGGEGPKRQDQLVKSKKSFNQFKSEIPISPSEVVKTTPFDNQEIEIKKPKKQRAPITRGRARKDKGLAPRPVPPKIEKKPSTFAKAVEKTKDFAKKDPLFALGTYDLGKGILGKILKTKSFAPGVVGGTVGRRTARGGGGL